MKTLASARLIKNHLGKLKPTRVAVAYVGAGWKNYVDVATLKEIIVSPTLGSNPKAIEEMIAHLGIENVHFLSRLHAKIYLAAEQALIGSCNLSDNALTEGRLVEVAVAVNGGRTLAALNAIFETCKEEACKEFPKAEDKRKRLEKLVLERSVAERDGLFGTNGTVPQIKSYSSKLDRIHVSWYQPMSGIQYEEGIDPDTIFSDSLFLREQDDIREGDWVLYWHACNDGMPRKNGDVGWLRVDDVISNAVKDNEPYSKLVGERVKRVGSFPFKLDPRTKASIRQALTQKQFADLRSDYIAKSDPVIPRFLTYLKVNS